MHGRPAAHEGEASHDSHPARWRILGVLVLALLVTSIDHTILNVALPQMAVDLQASAAQLQWLVDAYTLVFAGLLLIAGAVGDRFGRQTALNAGLVIFIAGSAISAMSSSVELVIAGRALMGTADGDVLTVPFTVTAR